MLDQEHPVDYLSRPSKLPLNRERHMFLMLSKKPRRTNRNRTARFKAKVAAKNRNRRNRIYQRV